MTSRHFGFSNIYLKVGFALIAISIFMAIAAFAVPSAAMHLSGRWAGFSFCAGVVLYAIGRIVQIMRSRAQA
mgnify:FL=1